MSMSGRTVSVIVPVFRGDAVIAGCLDALAAQSYDAGLREVIVVDNGGNVRLEETVARYPGTVYVREARRGSYAARNAGVARARGGILAFTDADCVPAPSWLEKGVARLAGTPRCGLVAGRIDFLMRRPGRPTAVELYDSLSHFDQRYYLEELRFGATANMFTTAEAMRGLGGFDAAMLSGGDCEYGRRVHAAGYRQVYADDAVVFHPARRSLAQLCEKTVRVARGERDLAPQRLMPVRRAVAFVREVLGAFSDPRLNGPGQALQFVAVHALVRVLRLRVLAAGPPGRRKEETA